MHNGTYLFSAKICQSWGSWLHHQMPCLFSDLFLTQPHFPETLPRHQNPPPIPGLLPVGESLQGRQTSHFQMLAASTLVVLVTYFPFVQQRLMSASTTQGALGRCSDGLCPSLKSSVCHLPKCSSRLCLLPAGLAPAAFRPVAPALDSCVNHWRHSAWGLRFYKHSPSYFPVS